MNQSYSTILLTPNEKNHSHSYLSSDLNPNGTYSFQINSNKKYDASLIETNNINNNEKK